MHHWLQCVYAGDIAGGMGSSRPALAQRLLKDQPALARQIAADPWLACAVGDLAVLRAATTQDPGWVHRPGGPLVLPPLVAVTHSCLLRLPEWREQLRACARLLLGAGADANQATGSRWPPASPAAPAADAPLSALYGAAGRNHDAVLAQLLLDAGANPNDGESLYHALEDTGCTRLLLQAGARVTGSNAMYRVLDLDALEVLQLLLDEGVHIRDMRSIVECIAEHAAQISDPGELARRIRVHLAPAIVQQIYGPAKELDVIALEPDLERLVTQALNSPHGAVLDPGVAESLTRQAADSVRKQENLGVPACLLVPDPLRAPLARLLKRAAPRLKVLAHSEIPETHSIRIGSIIGANA